MSSGFSDAGDNNAEVMWCRVLLQHQKGVTISVFNMLFNPHSRHRSNHIKINEMRNFSKGYGLAEKSPFIRDYLFRWTKNGEMTWMANENWKKSNVLQKKCQHFLLAQCVRVCAWVNNVLSTLIKCDISREKCPTVCNGNNRLKRSK